MNSRANIFVSTLTLAALAMLGRDTHAQDPSATASASGAAPVAEPAVRDFETEPPTEFGSKLDVANGWDTALRVKLTMAGTIRLAGHSERPCEFRVQKDWLRMRCKGGVGRVNQLAGDTGGAHTYISNQMFWNVTPKGGVRDDRRNVTVYVRLVPGELSVFELTHMHEGNYGGQWYEGRGHLFMVDWFDKSTGPRILLTDPPGY